MSEIVLSSRPSMAGDAVRPRRVASRDRGCAVVDGRTAQAGVAGACPSRSAGNCLERRRRACWRCATRSRRSLPGRWAGRSAMAARAGGFEERARAMIALAEEALAPSSRRAEGGLQALYRARAGRHRAHRRAVELSVSHGGQLRRAGADGRQCGAAQACRADAAGRRPLPEAMDAAGLPKGLFHTLVALARRHREADRLGRIDQICFTGSVAAGHAIERAAAGTFAALGLELGGKDPAYVRADADLEHAIENLVDGAYLQFRPMLLRDRARLCARGRLRPFVEGFADLTRKYVLGDPLEQATTLGPMARGAFAATIRGHIAEARRRRHCADQYEGRQATAQARPILRRRC